MILYPAIDLKDGQCVRLYQGDMGRATVFNHSPVDQARRFADEGAEWLHIVDLNGAFAGKPVNGAAVEAILKQVDIPVQLGGGIRDMAAISAWVERGVKRVVLGTVALIKPELVREACQKYPGRIGVGIDARNGMVAVEGWSQLSTISALELAQRFQDAGVDAIIHTDISRDGAMQGPNVQASAVLAEKITTPVIVSGGVASLADLRDCRRYQNHGINGVISGRALYENAFTVREAVAVLR